MRTVDEVDRRIPWETATKPSQGIALSVLVENHHISFLNTIGKRRSGLVSM
jgi:hypothetical protein